MDRDNCSSLTEFIFLRISENIENKVTLFTMVLLVYLINLLANLGMITLIRMDLQLHTPMYFASATSPSVTSALPLRVQAEALSSWTSRVSGQGPRRGHSHGGHQLLLCDPEQFAALLWLLK